MGLMALKGYVSTVIDQMDQEFDAIYSCGAPGMLKYVNTKFHDHPRAYISMESRMACGMGACYACVVHLENESQAANKRVCEDGPVFETGTICDVGGPYDSKSTSRILTRFRLEKPHYPSFRLFWLWSGICKYYDLDLMGSIMIKATTAEARFGNPTPRVAETPAGMLNAIGLQNPGVDVVLAEKLLGWPSIIRSYRIIANVAGFSNEEYATVSGKISQAPNVKAIELNISLSKCRPWE